MKKCKCCLLEKDLSCFEKSRAKCKICRKFQSLLYLSTSKGKATRKASLEKQKTTEKYKERVRYNNFIYFRSNNPDIKKARILSRKLRTKNKIKIKLTQIQIDKRSLYMRAYHAKRILHDPYYKLRKCISSQINKTIFKNNKSCLNYLPFSIKELKEHLESLFEPWMTWSNHGKYNATTHNLNPTWQIDHIIPHSTFKYNNMSCQQFKDCWSLNNLRPLDARLNQLDGATKVRHKF